MGGTKGEIQNPCQDYLLLFWIFPFGPPYEKMQEIFKLQAEEH